MHEAGIAQGIFDTVTAALPDGGAKVTRIVLVAGVFSGIERESLELYLEALVKGTPLEAAALEMIRKPAELVCKSCSHRRPYENEGDLPLACERCGGPNRLEGGNELYIESVEIDDET